MKTTLSIKFLLPFLFLIYGLHCTNAQVQETTIQMVSTYDLDLSKDQLRLSSQQMTPPQEQAIFAFDAQLTDNELIIKYQINSPEASQGLRIQLDILMNDEQIEPSPGYLIGKQGKIKTSDKTELILTNLTQELPYVKGELKLVFNIQWKKPLLLAHGVSCDQEPQFGLRQKLPYYSGAVIGLGGLVGSALIKNKAEQHFERHQNSDILSVRNAEYNKYTDQLNTAKLLTYASIGILTADVILYWLRQNKHKKRLKIYEEFCQKEGLKKERLSIQPYYELPTGPSLQQVGVHLSYQF